MIPEVDEHRPVTRLTGTVVTSHRYPRPVRFFVDNAGDTIQSKHLRGKFYEEDELLVLAGLLPEGMRVLDVGANVGNHTLFLAMFCAASAVTAIEPNPAACALMDINLALNGLHAVHRFHGVALSDATESGVMTGVSHNLGAATFCPQGDGAVRAMRGDELLAEAGFDFLKIDVEGMEMATLRGLEDLISRCRPHIFIEILEPSMGEFHAWVDQHRYHAVQVFEHPDMINYLLAPHGERQAAGADGEAGQPGLD